MVDNLGQELSPARGTRRHAPPPRDVVRERWITRSLYAAVIVLLIWSYQGAEISPQSLVFGLSDAWLYIVGRPGRPGSGYFPPDLSRLGEYASAMITTIKMAIWGTALSVPVAVTLAFLGANNTHGNFLVYQVVRRTMDFLRSLNELIIALVFVAAVGLGPFTGVLALAVGGVGSLGKLLSEAVEAADMDQIEGVRATGAHPLQVVIRGFWPQIVPLFLSYTLYRFEANVRSATVLGIVGAGGIGYYLIDAMRSFENRQTSTILIIIIASVSFIDGVSSAVRKRVT